MQRRFLVQKAIHRQLFWPICTSLMLVCVAVLVIAVIVWPIEQLCGNINRRYYKELLMTSRHLLKDRYTLCGVPEHSRGLEFTLQLMSKRQPTNIN